MSGPENCDCAYSHTCEYHQEKIEEERINEHREEMDAWTSQVLELIAKKLEVELPKKPVLNTSRDRRW